MEWQTLFFGSYHPSISRLWKVDHRKRGLLLPSFKVD